jgi:hypothetical protein
MPSVRRPGKNRESPFPSQLQRMCPGLLIRKGPSIWGSISILWTNRNASGAVPPEASARLAVRHRALGATKRRSGNMPRSHQHIWTNAWKLPGRRHPDGPSVSGPASIIGSHSQSRMNNTAILNLSLYHYRFLPSQSFFSLVCLLFHPYSNVV